MEERQSLINARRIVVKVGTNSLTEEDGGKISVRKCSKIVDGLQKLISMGKEVVLVTSGAGAAGVGRLGLPKKPGTLPEKQACAAVGQTVLMQMYDRLFSSYKLIVAQVLLTKNDIIQRRSYLNARNTLQTLLSYKTVPIINENDTVAVEELRSEMRFGENDTLSALVSGLVDAELLIILTDVEGLYDCDPRKNAKAGLIDTVKKITPEIETAAGKTGSAFSTGGMAAKLKAAKIVMQSGIHMVLAGSGTPSVLTRIVTGEKIGTLFVPVKNPLSSKKQWIAYGLTPAGKITVDGGAAAALTGKGKSLLPSGIIGVEGDFQCGDLVSIFNQDQIEIGRGLVNYSAEDVRKIAGHKTMDIEHILGYGGYEEVIHRDNMVCPKED